MEDSVALDFSKQKEFVKSIKGIKKRLKKDKKQELKTPEKPAKVKDGKIRKKPVRGLVYLSHIPHGFYEHEMTQYFKQFGVVTNARVIRSKRTGNSKGHAFVEFKDTAVAEIVADTMNNYLMGKRLIKAACIPPEKQKRKAMRKHWNAVNNPGNKRRIEMKKAYNANKDNDGDLKKAKKILSNLTKTKKKLSELGINYDFFTPVDVPMELLDKVIKQEDSKENIIDIAENNQKPSKKNKKKSQEIEKKEVIVEIKTGDKKKNVGKSEDKKQKSDKKNVQKLQKEEKAKEQELAKSMLKRKQDLKAKGVKPLEDFIKVQEDSDDSGSDCEFDSDEFEKMLENEDESSNVSSNEDSESEKEENDDEDGDTSEESDIESVQKQPPKKNKGKANTATKAGEKLTVAAKRKIPQKPPVATKKTKFEKQFKQKPINKQFKKK